MTQIQPPVVRLLAYAALACGGAIACLLLVSGPSQADDGGLPLVPADARPGDGGGAGEKAAASEDGAVEGRSAGGIGQRVADVAEAAGRGVEDVTAHAGRHATTALDGVAEVAPVAEPVAQRAGTVVERTTDVVGSRTGEVVEELGEQTVELTEPVVVPHRDPEAASPPPATPDAPVAVAPAAPQQSADPRQRESDDAPARHGQRQAAEHRSPAPAVTHLALARPEPTALPAPSGPVRPDAVTQAWSEPSAEDGVDRPAAPRPAGACTSCAASAPTSGGDTLHVYAVLGQSSLVAATAGPGAVDRASLGPAACFSLPEVSPG